MMGVLEVGGLMDQDAVEELSASLEAMLQGRAQAAPQASEVQPFYAAASSTTPIPVPTPTPAPAPQVVLPPETSRFVDNRTGHTSRTILIVDDNKDYRSLLKTALSGRCYQVMEAGDGASALQLLLRRQPDLVILDFNMPKMNGYELLQEIRSRAELRRIPVIMFTGAPNRQHLKSLHMDIADFLEKPVTNVRLLASIERVLASAPPVIAAGTPDMPPPAAVLPSEGPTAQSREAPQPAVEQPPLETAPPPAVAEPEEMLGEEGPEDFSEEGDIAVESVEDKKDEEVHGLEELARDSPLINRVNHILMRAVGMRASDIHIEPGENRVMVRVRIDGALRQLCTLPIAIHPRLTARIKIMANLSITERRLPQDGQFRAQIRGRKVEFRVSTLPCTRGEKIALRILGQSQLKGDLTTLGLTSRDLVCVEKALHAPHGLILLTGPTGSGKTTTLYTMISKINRPDVNIMTAEDPVEYEVANISQVHIRPAIGLTFESTLRAFLRQDPDIMLIGEIRDLETAEIAVKASITGHLVFSTLHTNSAPATVVRLTHMGLAPYLVAASVRLVIAQRLVRKLCPACKVKDSISDQDKKFLSDEEFGMLKTVYRGAGCPACHQTGYMGRKPVFEVMPVESPALRQLIISENRADMLHELVLQEGMTPLRQAALSAVASGETSMEEALKIILGG